MRTWVRGNYIVEEVEFEVKRGDEILATITPAKMAWVESSVSINRFYGVV